MESFMRLMEINKIINNLPSRYKSFIPRDELVSEVNYTFLLCSKNYNPKIGNFGRYFRVSLNNRLHNLHRSLERRRKYEVSLGSKDYLYSHQFDEDDIKIIAFLRNLPENFVNTMTEFVYGKIKKGDLVARSPFSEEIIDRIIMKLDKFIAHKVG